VAKFRKKPGGKGRGVRRGGKSKVKDEKKKLSNENKEDQSGKKGFGMEGAQKGPEYCGRKYVILRENQKAMFGGGRKVGRPEFFQKVSNETKK